MKDSLPDHWLHSPPLIMLNGVPPFSPPPTTQELQSTTFGNCSGGVKKKQKTEVGFKLGTSQRRRSTSTSWQVYAHACCTWRHYTHYCNMYCSLSLSLSLSHAHCTSPHLSLLSSSLHSFLSLLALLIICLTSSSNIQSIFTAAPTQRLNKKCLGKKYNNYKIACYLQHAYW